MPAVPQRVPILEYHVIANPQPGAPYPKLYVRTRDFSIEMSWLARHGFHAVKLDRVLAAWTRGKPLPRRPVVLTFDDGYRSVYTHAFPILREYRWPGNVNLVVRRTQFAAGLPPRRVRALIAADWEIDAHTMTHADVTTLSGARLRYEIAGSRRWLRRHFHVPVHFFCYPSGHYDARAIAAVRAAGYLGGESEQQGFATLPERWAMPRIRVNLDEPLSAFAHALEVRR